MSNEMFWAINNYRYKRKEISAMQVSYNGFTGELVKLEKKGEGIAVLNWVPGMPKTVDCKYDLSIYDSEKQVTYSFASVNLKDVKFLGGAVSFGG